MKCYLFCCVLAVVLGVKEETKEKAKCEASVTKTEASATKSSPAEDTQSYSDYADYILPSVKDCSYCKDWSIQHLNEGELTATMWENEFARPGFPVLVKLKNPRWTWGPKEFKQVVDAGLDVKETFTLHSVRNSSTGLTFDTSADECTRGNSQKACKTLENLAQQIQDNPSSWIADESNWDPEKSGVDWYASWTCSGFSTQFPNAIKIIQEKLNVAPSFIDQNAIQIIDDQWFFVGAQKPGNKLAGREFHHDQVNTLGTFHFQLSGAKRWRLRPLQFCHKICGNAAKEVVVPPGHFFSLNTDYWEHSTDLIQSEDMPALITGIASEYHNLDDESDFGGEEEGEAIGG